MLENPMYLADPPEPEHCPEVGRRKKRMAKRRSTIDVFIDAYLEMDPAERPFAMAALKGADRALKDRQLSLPKTDQAAAEELGAAAAGEGEPE